MALRNKIWKHTPDKCNPPPVDMGHALVFCNSIPGRNDTYVRPFGWTEYESAYRHQYVPDPCPARRPCVDPCRPKGVDRKPNKTEWVDCCRRYRRPGICNWCHRAKCCCPIPPPWDELKEKVVIYDRDNVRSLIAHEELKNEHPFVLSCKHYDNIVNNVIQKPKEEKEAELREHCRVKELARMECKEKADELRLIDAHRMKDEMSPEAREDMNEIICRSQAILKDDEPEVRTINAVILAAKVQAIREAQLAEKELIKCEQAEEERRVLALLQQDKAHALITDDDQEVEKMEQKRRELMESLTLQLQDKEAMNYLRKEREEAENCAIRQIWEQQDIQEMQEQALRVQKKHRLGCEFLEDQMLQLDLKKQLKQREKLEDQRVMDWYKQKAAQEEAMEKEKAAQRMTKELSVKAVLDTQKKTEDDKLLRDEMRARRHVELQEREWRRKEKEEILKRERDAQELKASILDQIESRQQFLVEQAAYDKAMFDKINDVQDEKFEEERKALDERQAKNARYRYDIREQIHTYQLQKVEERKSHFIEGIKLRRDMNQRDAEIRCNMERKLDQLKKTNLPDKFINYVRRAAEEELKPEWQKKMSKK